MPRLIIGGAFLSMDGVMQGPGGPQEDPTGGFTHGGWVAGAFDEALGRQVDSLFTPPYDLLLGRKTYEIFAAHWPYVGDDDPIAAGFRKARKYVLTGGGMALSWEGSERLADMDAVAALKATDGPNLIIQGSSTLYPQLLARGLIDRLVLMTSPVVLGSGKRLFGDGTPAGAFRLVEQRSSVGGNVMTTYEPDGPVKIGDFTLEQPTEAEAARREKMAREG